MMLIKRLFAQSNMEADQSTASLLREAAEALALAQPRQEPVGKWVGNCIEWTENPYKFKDGQPIYISPPARKPLTDEQWLSVGRQARDAFFGCKQDSVLTQIDFATRAAMRATEAAHGIKD